MIQELRKLLRLKLQRRQQLRMRSMKGRRLRLIALQPSLRQKRMQEKKKSKTSLIQLKQKRRPTNYWLKRREFFSKSYQTTVKARCPAPSTTDTLLKSSSRSILKSNRWRN